MDGPVSFQCTDEKVSGMKRSRLPEFEQTVLRVCADEVLMWMMNNTNHVFLMDLAKTHNAVTFIILLLLLPNWTLLWCSEV